MEDLQPSLKRRNNAVGRLKAKRDDTVLGPLAYSDNQARKTSDPGFCAMAKSCQVSCLASSLRNAWRNRSRSRPLSATKAASAVSFSSQSNRLPRSGMRGCQSYEEAGPRERMDPNLVRCPCRDRLFALHVEPELRQGSLFTPDLRSPSPAFMNALWCADAQTYFCDDDYKLTKVDIRQASNQPDRSNAGLWQCAGLHPITAKRPSQFETLAEGERHVRIPAHAIFSATVTLAGCQATPQEAARPDRPVLVQTVAFEPRAPERTFVATIKPRIESDLGFRVPGKSRRARSMSETASRRAMPAALDETDLRLQREQSEAEISAASAALVHAEAELKRIMTLRNEGWSTAAVLDRQKAATEEARGRVTRRASRFRLPRTPFPTRPWWPTPTASSPPPRSNPAKWWLRDSRRSALPGCPKKRRSSPCRKRRSLRSEAVRLPSRSGRTRAVATLPSCVNCHPRADSTTRTYLARFSLPSAEESVQLGMTATVTVGDETAARVVRLPLSALYNQGNGPAVWVIDVDGRPKLRPVEVAAYEARSVLVARGLREGETVVTLGVQKLDEGQRVRVVEALRF